MLVHYFLLCFMLSVNEASSEKERKKGSNNLDWNVNGDKNVKKMEYSFFFMSIVSHLSRQISSLAESHKSSHMFQIILGQSLSTYAKMQHRRHSHKMKIE